MAKANPIAPFPSDIDRDAFGYWLSGFTDGEGCFCLQDGKPRRPNDKSASLTPSISISLRRDDLPILQLIQSYWQCGGIVHYGSYAPKVGRPRLGNPSSLYYIHAFSDLANIVVPHFERYPLFAKKKRDFAIWKQAVLLKAEVAARKYRGLPSGKGCTPKWTDAEVAFYRSLKAALEAGRRYNSKTTSTPDRPPRPNKPKGLFDQ